MIAFGANPKYQSDQPFLETSKKYDADIVSFFINQYNPDFIRLNLQICNDMVYKCSELTIRKA